MPRLAYFKNSAPSDSSQDNEISQIKLRLNNVEANKANTSDVNSQLSQKADTWYVNTRVDEKASSTYVDTQLATKAATSYVDSQLATKTSSFEHQTLINEVTGRKFAENAWITAVKDVLYIESSEGSGAEFDYSALGISQ